MSDLMNREIAGTAHAIGGTKRARFPGTVVA